MTQAWLTLTSADGRDIAAPTEKQLAAALSELYELGKNMSRLAGKSAGNSAGKNAGKVARKSAAGKGAGAQGASEAASSEPVTAALRFGYDDGLMYVAEVSSTGELRFEEWSDRDCEIALATPRRMSASKATALELWSLMARRQVSKIRDLAWQSGP